MDDTLSTVEFARLAGVSYRVADYWDRCEILVPSIEGARGTGSARRYSQEDVAIGTVLGALAAHGARQPILRRVVHELRRTPQPWPEFLSVNGDGDLTWSTDPADVLGDLRVAAGWIVRVRPGSAILAPV